MLNMDQHSNPASDLMTMRFLIASTAVPHPSPPPPAIHAPSSDASFLSIPSTYSPIPSLDSFASMSHLSKASASTTTSTLSVSSLGTGSPRPMPESALFSSILQNSTESMTLLNGSTRLGWLYFQQKFVKKSDTRSLSLDDWSASLALRLRASDSPPQLSDASFFALRIGTLSSELLLAATSPAHPSHRWHDLPESQPRSTRLLDALSYYYPTQSFKSTADASYYLCRLAPESDTVYEILFAVLLEDVSVAASHDMALDLSFDVAMSFAKAAPGSDAWTHSSVSWHGHPAFPLLSSLVQEQQTDDYGGEKKGRPSYMRSTPSFNRHFGIGPLPVHYLSMFCMSTPQTRLIHGKTAKSPATNLSTTLGSRTSLLLSNGFLAGLTPVLSSELSLEQRLLYFEMASSFLLSDPPVRLHLVQLIVKISDQVYDRLQLEDWTLHANGHDRFAIAHPILEQGEAQAGPELAIWLLGEYQMSSQPNGHVKFIKFIPVETSHVAT